MKDKCWKCGSRSDVDQSALLLGRKPYKRPCEICGAELCPSCGHRRAAHVPKHDDPLQDRCEITWDGAFCCECSYYRADFDGEIKWNIVPFHEGTLGS